MKKQKVEAEVKIDQVLLKNRVIFLSETITEDSAKKINQQLIALDRIAKTPIYLWINSRGGEVNSGFAIIDTIRAVKTPVVTIIAGYACSMAGVISICGDIRLMTENSIWMAHDMTAGIHDYATKLIERADYYKRLQKQLFDIIRRKTKLSESEIKKAINEELWLNSIECKNKSIVDKILKGKP